MAAVASAATVTTVGLVCKAFFGLRLASMSVHGLPNLLDALNSEERQKSGRGVITVCNHISTLDDPVAWAALPTSCYFRSRTTRWSLGASELMFTNPVTSTFFRLGQVLETFRGQGIYQPAVDTAIDKLNSGAWIHLFGEGKINQPSDNSYHLPRFKWGVGRMLMEATQPPIVIPMFLTGFHHLMPIHRPFPYNYLPRLGARISVTFGEPLQYDFVQSLMIPSLESDRRVIGDEMEKGAMDEKKLVGEELDRVRSKVTERIHDAVEELGKRVLERQMDNSQP